MIERRTAVRLYIRQIQNWIDYFILHKKVPFKEYLNNKFLISERVNSIHFEPGLH